MIQSVKQSNSYDEARNVFLSCVAERTRCKRDAYIEAISGHASAGISGPTCKNADETGSHGVSASNHRTQIKPTQRVRWQKKRFGDMDFEKIDKAEFMLSQKKRRLSNIRPSTDEAQNESYSVGTSRKAVDSVNQTISSDDCSKSYGPKDASLGSDQAWLKKSSSSLQIIAKAQTTIDVDKLVSLDNRCGSPSSEYVGTNSDSGESDKSSSFAEKGKRYNNIDSDKDSFQKIDESEFKSKKTNFSATSGENINKLRQKISFTEKIDENRVEREVSSYSRQKKNNEYWEKNLHDDDVKNSYVQCLSSDSSSHINGENIDIFRQDDEVNSYQKIIKKPSEVHSVPLVISDDSGSSSADNGFHSSGDEDFEVDSYSSDDIELLCSNVEARKNVTKNNGICHKQEAKVAKRAPKRKRLSDGEKSHKQPAFHRQKELKTPEEKEEIHKILGDDANSERGSKQNVAEVRLTDEMKKLNETKKFSSESHDLCRMFAYSILETAPILEKEKSDEENKQQAAVQTQNNLPSKFRFENEVLKEVEKTEYEKEIERLFSELEFNLGLDEVGSFNYHEVDQENANVFAKETQHKRCVKGKHELILEDDEGLICIYCRHVALGPKDVMPQWVEKTHRESERKRNSEAEQPLEFNELHIQSSTDNLAGISNSTNGTVWSIKPGIRESMYEHQQEGFEFLWKNLAGSIKLNELKRDNTGGVGGCIISHAPGTGKTRLTIVFVETYLKLFRYCRPMIIAPASMLLTWEEEFKKWNVEFPFHNLSNPELSGRENKAALEVLGGTHGRKNDVIRLVKISSWNIGSSVLGISYSLFEKLTGETYIKGKKKKVIMDDKMKAMRKILLEKPGLVVLDEGHTPRNERSNIWNVLLKLQTEKRVILSGTPFQNNFAELFNTLRIVRPAIADELAKEKTFAEMIALRKKSRRETSRSTFISDHAVEKLKFLMSPFVHVHKGTILQKSLPGLRDCVVLLKPQSLQKTLIEQLEGFSTSFEFEHKVALISVHPYLFQHCDSTEDQKVGIDLAAVEASKLNPNEGDKTKFIMEFVRLSVAMNEKVLIFSQYIQPLELIKEQMKDIFSWIEGKQILQMQGKLEQKQRQILINMFNDPHSESKVMLASTRCCSEGISLVGASRVILLDVVWNPSVERQAICRAYRIGQKKFVYTYHLMTCGTTEADKYCRQAEKERLSELVFTSSSNESCKEKHCPVGIEDRILEEMVGHEKLKGMFEKIINQPKDKNLIQSFGLTS
ncbi:DNA repair protein, SNF2 family [Handroanthus impetiginosus]|uniref:DNA repair protein, SNF2 family n=1 Tax=Handroanthus impetiginosus TaxID=429701 RepID=A0A2G9GRS9_9LAMI|nr:DNA repair protein, SNF2 family [Handroanthus impetiginosus]